MVKIFSAKAGYRSLVYGSKARCVFATDMAIPAPSFSRVRIPQSFLIQTKDARQTSIIESVYFIVPQLMNDEFQELPSTLLPLVMVSMPLIILASVFLKGFTAMSPPLTALLITSLSNSQL